MDVAKTDVLAKTDSAPLYGAGPKLIPHGVTKRKLFGIFQVGLLEDGPSLFLLFRLISFPFIADTFTRSIPHGCSEVDVSQSLKMGIQLDRRPKML